MSNPANSDKVINIIDLFKKLRQTWKSVEVGGAAQMSNPANSDQFVSDRSPLNLLSPLKLSYFTIIRPIRWKRSACPLSHSHQFFLGGRKISDNLKRRVSIE